MSEKLTPLIQSKNFYVGFDNRPNDDIKRGRIYLRGNHFANFYSLDESWGKKTNWIAFNRDGLALNLNCPVIMETESLEILLNKLEEFLKTINF